MSLKPTIAPIDPLADAIKGAANGDRAAARQIIAALGGPLLALGFRMLQDRAAAEDALQDTYIRLWPKLADWDFGRAKLATFARTIMVNQCLDRLRRAKNWVSGDDADHVFTNLAASGASADEKIVEREILGHQRQQLDMALAKLPPRQRVALVIFYAENGHLADIAAMLDLSEAAAESLLRRARTGLRKLILSAAGAQIDNSGASHAPLSNLGNFLVDNIDNHSKEIGYGF